MKGIVSKTILLASLVTALFCVTATADITLAWDTPGWYGTHQMWTFDSAPGNYDEILPEVDDNPYPEDPFATISAELDSTAQFTDGPFYKDTYGGRDGIVYASPIMRIGIWIPNGPLDRQKIVQVELQYAVQNTAVSGYMKDAYLQADLGGEVLPAWYTEETTGGWTDLTLEFHFPQSDALTGEWIWLGVHDSGVNLDSIEVATICVPIPGAVLLGMLGLSYAGMRLRKVA